MSLILLEALGAGALLVLIVWWTMFSGRDRGEPPPDAADMATPPAPQPTSDEAPVQQDAPKPDPSSPRA